MKNLILELEHIIKFYDEKMLDEFENTLYEIHNLNDQNVISKLLLLLNDDFEFDELMFSIIHTIEVFEDKIYIKEIFKTLPDFIYKSPRWASIVFMRILNAETSKDEFKNHFKDLNKIKKDSVSNLFLNISKEDEEIKSIVFPFLN